MAADGFSASDIEKSWRSVLEPEFDQPYMVSLGRFLAAERASGKSMFPSEAKIFNAFNLTPLDAVKVVILGQDPYHDENQAHGLCFSVRDNIKPPPSLINIFKEIRSDLGSENKFQSGDLSSWAKQGVLLLNSVLTVRAHEAGSHQNQGWETFTDRVIEMISVHKQHCVFLFWGAYAQKKGQIIDGSKHLVLMSPHPSPLAAYRGFFGNKHFSECNAYLEHHQQRPINWFIG